jgi:hypothetical protein
VRYWYLCRLQVYVSVNLASLALQAGPGHLGNGLGHLWPAEPGCDEVVGRIPGWCIECSDWKTTSLCWIGTSGRNTPVETSPSSVVSPTDWVVICSLEEFVISATSGQVRWSAAIAEKSTGCASAMAARMGRSVAASPSSGQSSAMGAGEGVGCVAAAARAQKADGSGRPLLHFPGPVCVGCLR